MVDPLDIARRLLRKIGGRVSDPELSGWARERLKELEAEEPGPFAGDEESLKDILKRCAIAGDPGFELSEEEMRSLLGRLGASSAPLRPEHLHPRGPFLVCRRVGILPSGARSFLSICPRCSARISLPARRLARWGESEAALVCTRCARSLPGRWLDELPPG